MGFFSRKKSDSAPGRPETPSEAQIRDLRNRARQRLIGALALVVAAVVVVPMLLQPDTEYQAQTPVVVPAIPPIPEPLLAEDEPASDATLDGQPQVSMAPLLVPEPFSESSASPATKPDIGSSHDQAAPVETKPQPKPEPKADTHPKPVSKPDTTQRTDDGSVAIALLEGRKPAAPKPAAATGNFVVQIAAYTTEADAQARRDGLLAAGVTNAFVESANPDGKTTYRLRVGPFPTREAAQAAQTRLRSLDYVNSFIASQ